MPQMAPYNWLILFYLFNLILLYIIMHNHFIYTPLPPQKYLKLNSFYKWKW